MSDERKGWPSASGMERVKLCPGSVPLTRKHADEPPPASEDASSGQRIHTIVERLVTKRKIPADSFSVSEFERAETIASQMKAVIADISAIVGQPDTGWVPSVETRFWSQTPAGNLFSGRYDLASLNLLIGQAIVLDAKSGWLEVPPAPDNLQLRTLAVLAWRVFGVSNITVGIVQPHRQKPSLAIYDEVTLKAAEKEIHRYIDAALAPNAPRRPSVDACRHCPVKHRCPEINAIMMNLSEGRLPKTWTEAFDHVELAEMVVKDLRARMKELLTKDPTSIPGLGLKPGRVLREIPDVKAARDRLSDLISPDDFVGLCKPSMEKMVDAYSKAASCKSKKKAQELLLNRLGELITESKADPSIVRVDPTKPQPASV